jgi:hypothetical protein
MHLVIQFIVLKSRELRGIKLVIECSIVYEKKAKLSSGDELARYVYPFQTYNFPDRGVWNFRVVTKTDHSMLRIDQ